jgi:membrane protein required for beta-lactamase induction
MKREIKLSAAIDRLLKFGPDMAEQDRVALENAIVGEFEDILPTYKGVKDDGVSRLYEYAARNNIGGTPVEEVEEKVKAVEPSPVITKVLREFEEQQAAAAPVEVEEVVEVVVEEAPKPKTPRARKPRAKKATPSE